MADARGLDGAAAVHVPDCDRAGAVFAECAAVGVSKGMLTSHFSL